MFDLNAQRSLVALRIMLGLILALEAAILLTNSAPDHRDALVSAFAAAQGTGALLFLWTRTLRIGACFLICAFVAAAIFHLLDGDFPSDHLVAAIAVLFVTLQVQGKRVASLGAQRA